MNLYGFKEKMVFLPCYAAVMKPLIHFAHANGIPSQTYQKLFTALSDDYDVIYVPLLGASEYYPVDNHWKILTQQVIDSIESQAQGRQVIGVGHSLGALTTFMASRLRPDLFSQVIMLDPPMIVGAAGFMMHIAKIIAPGFVDKHTPAALSAKRRDHWANPEEAKEKLNLSSKTHLSESSVYKRYKREHKIGKFYNNVDLVNSKRRTQNV